MFRRLYTVLFYCMTPFILLRLYWKGRKVPEYRQRIHERFSWGKIVSSEVDVWLHAVSLGEVVAATSLIDALLAKQLRVLVTTMTPTGSQQVVKRFGKQVSHQYIPYDIPYALRRFFKAINARAGVIMETELWPNLIDQANRFGMPLFLLNARISDKAMPSYRTFQFFFKSVVSQLTMIVAQSENDAERFKELGAHNDRVQVLGNMKFDLQIRLDNPKVFQNLKNTWGTERTVVIAASTHSDEEKQILSILKILQMAIPNCILLIAARHPDRFNTVYELSQKQGYMTGLRSQPDTINQNTEVVILDSLGELLGFYQTSDFAFVGGSFVPIGGHNILEPIAMNVPAFCGPYMNNSKSICQDLCNAGALQQVDNAWVLAEKIIELYQDPHARMAQISNARKVLEANQGSVNKCAEVILKAIQ